MVIRLTLEWLLATAHAGGGPANVLILYNEDEEQAEELAHYYRDARAIPHDHLCPVDDVDPAWQTISFDDYEATIRVALDDCLEDLQQPEEIHTLVLVRGLPYRVDIEGGFSTSLQAMLQVGDTWARSDGAPLAGTPQASLSGTWMASIQNPAWIGNGSDEAYTVTNPYSSNYRTAPGIAEALVQSPAFTRRDMDYGGTWDTSSGIFLVSRLDGFDFADGYDLVDRAIAAEQSVPTAPITCMAAADSARGARDPECAYTIEMLDAVGVPAQWIESHDAALAGEDMAAYLTGTTSLQGAIDGNTYAPGAFACNLTSTGAFPNNFFCDETGTTCPESESQTSIARFIRAGLTGAHGTVAEPLNNSFPGAGMLLLYTMGYSMTESAFLTQRYIYWQNIYLGDPLTAPWAERPVVTLEAANPHPSNEPIVVSATHTHGIAEIILYVNGKRVASEADADTLVYATIADTETKRPHPPPQLDLLAIAVANNAVIARPGWPSGETLPQPDVHGWANVQTSLGSPTVDDDASDTGSGDPSADSGDPPHDSDPAAAKDGCSCAATHPGLSPRWALLGLVLRTRRQPTPRTHPHRRSGRRASSRRAGRP